MDTIAICGAALGALAKIIPNWPEVHWLLLRSPRPSLVPASTGGETSNFVRSNLFHPLTEIIDHRFHTE
jgi:hypothetical protein